MRYGILASLFLAASCSYGSLEDSKHVPQKPIEAPTKQRPSTAAEWLETFPDNIDGAREVRKYPIPDSRYCLVHIRQLHNVEIYKKGLLRSFDIFKSMYDSNPNVSIRIRNKIYTNPEDAWTALKETEKEIELVQGDLYKITKDLMDKIGLEDIYFEGLAAYSESEERLDQVYDLMTAGMLLEPEEVRQNVNSELEWLAPLYWTGKLKIRGAELADQHAIAGELIRGGVDLQSSEEGSQVVDMREYSLLSIAFQRENPLVVTIFGADHAWGGKESCGESYPSEGRLSIDDNLALWNSLYPDKKFSLIEVIPDNLK